jgi:GT2 family glycosyltransferase
VQSPDNIGFGRCNNLGARHAQGRYLLFLNPDTELLEDSLSLLIGRMNSLPGAGAVGCKLLNSNMSLQTLRSVFSHHPEPGF